MAYISAKSSHAESVTCSTTRDGEVKIIKGELVVLEHATTSPASPDLQSRRRPATALTIPLYYN
jgi:hypothetical protein